jgi:hypothetical protein
MKATFYSLILSCLVFYSCKKDDNVTPKTRTNVVPFTQMTLNTPTTTATIQSNAYVAKEEKKESIMYQYKYTVVNKPNSKISSKIITKPGMNPPHGEPKHRCDIPVGAPLNSAIPTISSNPKSTATLTAGTSNTPTVPPLLATTTETTTPEGMNPAHGQPKHRCDIAVGAPLPKE